MQEGGAAYSEVDLRELSAQGGAVCALDGKVFDISLVVESEPALRELVGCNLNEVAELVQDLDPQLQLVREQIEQLHLHPIGRFISLRHWEQHHASSTSFKDAKCPFASQNKTAVRCPFARPKQPSHAPMTEAQLSLHNGSTPGLPRMTCFDGLIFNVTQDDRSFGEGGMFEEVVGRDGTEFIMSKLPNARREQIAALFEAQYGIVGRLVADPEPTADREEAAQLHQHIDDNNVEAVESMFEACEKTANGRACLTALANATCPRTGMSALHKAVEANRLEIAKVLLIHGASQDTPTPLYDGDTPLQLARRLGRSEVEQLLSDHNNAAENGK